jgi:hypothetical protein
MADTKMCGSRERPNATQHQYVYYTFEEAVAFFSAIFFINITA